MAKTVEAVMTEIGQLDHIIHVFQNANSGNPEDERKALATIKNTNATVFLEKYRNQLAKLEVKE